MPKPDQGRLFTPAPLPVAALDDAQRLACLRLIRSENVGPVTFRELINHYGGAAVALEALPNLSRRGGRGRPIRICPVAAAESELEAAHRAGATPLFTIEAGYPAHLAHVEAPPPVVYVKGNTRLLQRPMIAIVGSRLASAAGIKMARHMAKELASAGLVVVSGLARGIDKAAHEASLDDGTVAVVAGGIDHVYPPEHAGLQDEIARRGCLVSEMPPGTIPRAQEFPRRNRIIAGLSHGVVVVEAARKSGTLMTARLANELGREVFAVPGHPLDPRAEGTNRLLKQGATLVTEAGDILSVLEPQLAAGVLREAPAPAVHPAAILQPPPLVTDPDRDAVLAALGPAPVDIDSLSRATGLPARTISVLLMELDLAGRIERHGGQLVSLAGTEIDG